MVKHILNRLSTQVDQKFSLNINEIKRNTNLIYRTQSLLDDQIIAELREKSGRIIYGIQFIVNILYILSEFAFLLFFQFSHTFSPHLPYHA